jgi:hypothetical protein
MNGCTHDTLDMSSKRSNTQSHAHLVEVLNHVSHSGFKFQMARRGLITTLSKALKDEVNLQLCVTINSRNKDNERIKQLLQSPSVTAVVLKGDIARSPWNCGAMYEPEVLISQLHSGVKEVRLCGPMSSQCSRSCCSLVYPTDLHTLDLNRVKIMGSLPQNLKKLSIRDSRVGSIYPPLPEGLTTLSIKERPSVGGVREITYPTSLQVLDIDVRRVNPHQHIPVELVECTISTWGNFTMSALPSSLRVLNLSGSDFNHPFEIPPALQFLWLSGAYNHPLTNLPTSLRMLHLGCEFTSEIEALPSGLQVLIFQGVYGRKKIPEVPQSLLKLVLPLEYEHDFEAHAHLRELTIQVEARSDWKDFDRSSVCRESGLRMCFHGKSSPSKPGGQRRVIE